jgi:hypothetical protein
MKRERIERTKSYERTENREQRTEKRKRISHSPSPASSKNGIMHSFRVMRERIEE